MHRAWPVTSAEADGPVAQGGEGAADGGIIDGGAGVEEVADLHAEETGLVRGLVGAPAPQLRGAVGREEDEGESSLVGLHDRRVPMGGGTAGGGEEGDRLSAGPGQPEGEKGRAALVEDRREGQGPVALAGQDQRGGP